MPEVEDLGKKAWFRFFKLCYVFTYVALVFGVLLFAYSALSYSIIEAGKVLLWGLGTVILLGELIRRSFLYVVAGRPFFTFRRPKS